MKAILKKATITKDYSLNIHKDVGPEMLSSWHYHPEIELLLIKRSSGICLIGDNASPFKHGDTFLFGTNLPHTFKHESKYMYRNDEKIGESIVVLFHQETWDNYLLNLPEFHCIHKVFEAAKLGLKMKGITRRKVARIIDEMYMEGPSKRFILLLKALEIIASSMEFDTLSSSGFFQNINPTDKSRINKVFEYTYANFQNKIQIQDVADLISMGKHSFCRYFKMKTKKTYLDFLIEVRIGHACRLLVEQDLNVAEIGYACGYNNLSHFYHQFKSATNKQPLDYRAQYAGTQNKLISAKTTRKSA